MLNHPEHPDVIAVTLDLLRRSTDSEALPGDSERRVTSHLFSQPLCALLCLGFCSFDVCSRFGIAPKGLDSQDQRTHGFLKQCVSYRYKVLEQHQIWQFLPKSECFSSMLMGPTRGRVVQKITEPSFTVTLRDSIIDCWTSDIWLGEFAQNIGARNMKP